MTLSKEHSIVETHHPSLQASKSKEFEIPAKAKKILAIKPPSPEAENEHVQKRPVAQQVTLNSPRKNRTSTQQKEQRTTKKVEPQTNDPTLSARPVNGHYHPGSSSHLDIFAAKYVPKYQVAANESFASVHSPPRLPTIDYDAYIATFAGSAFVEPCPPVEMLVSCHYHFLHHNLTATCYTPYWRERLQLESTAQAVQYQSFTLFNVKLQIRDLNDSLFTLKVPGLRENTPRLDLADIVIIRPLAAVLHGNIERLVEHWYERADFGAISPGFSGQEYHAVVWYISRRDETVVLKGPPAMNGLNLGCNVIFPITPQKHEPFHRSVVAAGEVLSGETFNSWIHAMIFPEMSDGALQTKLSTGVFDSKWFDGGLNFEQKKAIQAVKDNQYGIVPYLISGPPGTGKTKTLVELAMQMLTASVAGRTTPHLLLCAPSDAAADTLVVRLSKYLSINEMFRLNNWTRTSTEVPGQVLPYCYQNSNNLFSLPDFKKFMSYRVVVTSCRDADMLVCSRLTNDVLATLAADMLKALYPSTRIDKSKLVHWTALLLDEAAQATEPEALVPISVVIPAIADQSENTVQVVMAGDEYQLGPRLTPLVPFCDLPLDKALSTSLFARLFARTLYARHPLARSQGSKPLTASMLPIIRPPFTNLIRNYRSHPAILAVPSTLFYADTLIPEHSNTSVSISSWPEWPSGTSPRWPVLFHNRSSPDAVESITEGDGTGASSLTNHIEAQYALDYAASLLLHTARTTDPLRQEDIIVLSPFRAQVSLLRNMFRVQNLHEVNIGPLEAFQGLEARVVIICTTRTRLGTPPHSRDRFVREDQSRSLGIIDEPKRFNVAMTRAKDALLVIGSADCLTSTDDKCWLGFLSFCWRNELVIGDTTYTSRYGSTTNPGKLETALNWAEMLNKRDGQGNRRDEHGHLQPKTNSEGRAGTSRFMLQGRVIDLDEAMVSMSIDGTDFDDGDEVSKYTQDEESSDGNTEPLFDVKNTSNGRFSHTTKAEHDVTTHERSSSTRDLEKEFPSEFF